jgi:hypothetical protein
MQLIFNWTILSENRVPLVYIERQMVSSIQYIDRDTDWHIAELTFDYRKVQGSSCPRGLNAGPVALLLPVQRLRGILYQGSNYQTKQTPWPLVRKRTILTERPQLVDEI